MNPPATLDQLFDCMFRISKKASDRQTDWRGERASILFSKIALTCVCFLRLVPGSNFYKPINNLVILDIASAATLCRNLVEAFCVLEYLCDWPSDEDERRFRIALWRYQDAWETLTMAQNLTGSAKIPALELKLNEAKFDLEQCHQFQALHPTRQKTIIKKGKTFMLPDAHDLSRKAGVSEYYFRLTYRLCSGHTHSSPASLRQMDRCITGSVDAARAINVLTAAASIYVSLALRRYIELWPDTATELTKDIEQTFVFWEGVSKWKVFPNP